MANAQAADTSHLSPSLILLSPDVTNGKPQVEPLSPEVTDTHTLPVPSTPGVTSEHSFYEPISPVVSEFETLHRHSTPGVSTFYEPISPTVTESPRILLQTSSASEAKQSLYEPISPEVSTSNKSCLGYLTPGVTDSSLSGGKVVWTTVSYAERQNAHFSSWGSITPLCSTYSNTPGMPHLSHISHANQTQMNTTNVVGLLRGHQMRPQSTESVPKPAHQVPINIPPMPGIHPISQHERYLYGSFSKLNPSNKLHTGNFGYTACSMPPSGNDGERGIFRPWQIARPLPIYASAWSAGSSSDEPLDLSFKSELSDYIHDSCKTSKTSGLGYVTDSQAIKEDEAIHNELLDLTINSVDCSRNMLLSIVSTEEPRSAMDYSRNTQSLSIESSLSVQSAEESSSGKDKAVYSPEKKCTLDSECPVVRQTPNASSTKGKSKPKMCTNEPKSPTSSAGEPEKDLEASALSKCGGVGRGFISLVSTPVGDIKVGACIICQSIYMDFPHCPMCLAHGQVIGLHSAYSVPPPRFDLRASSLKHKDVGVFVRRPIVKGTIIGPLKGKVVNLLNLPNERTGHQWPLLRTSVNNAHLFLNTRDRRTNWLSNIQHGRQNDYNVTILLQYDCQGKGSTEIFFVSTQVISVDEELLVNPADLYDKDWVCESCETITRGRFFYLSHLMSAHRPIMVYTSFLEVICFLKQQANENAVKEGLIPATKDAVLVDLVEEAESDDSGENSPVDQSSSDKQAKSMSEEDILKYHIVPACAKCDSVHCGHSECPFCTATVHLHCPDPMANKHEPGCPQLGLGPSTVSPGEIGIVAGVDLPKGVLFGPLKGPRAKRVHAPQNKTNLWPLLRKNICLERVFIDTSDPSKSSWLRNLQTGTVEKYNVEIVIKVYINTNVLYFVTTKEVGTGEELLLNPAEMVAGDWCCVLCQNKGKGRLYYLDHLNFHKKCRENLYVPSIPSQHSAEQTSGEARPKQKKRKKQKKISMAPKSSTKYKEDLRHPDTRYPCADIAFFRLKGACSTCGSVYTDFEECPFCNTVLMVPFNIQGDNQWCTSEFEVKASTIEGHDLGFYSKIHLPRGCIIGPMQGKKMIISELPDNTELDHVRVVTRSRGDGGVLYTADPDSCNSLRHINVGLSYRYNVITALKEEEVYYITTLGVSSGSELFYRPVEPLYFNQRMVSQVCCSLCEKLFPNHAHCVRHRILVHRRLQPRLDQTQHKQGNIHKHSALFRLGLCIVSRYIVVSILWLYDTYHIVHFS